MTRTLHGITWDHSRALPPLVAAAQRYEETHPGVRIHWEKRTLHEFGHMPIDVLAGRFDLIVIDHPWAGYCFKRQLIHDLASLGTDYGAAIDAQAYIGASFESYHYAGKLMALPIDAATPLPSWRPDLLEKAGLTPPATWQDTVTLSDSGRVIMPAFPADLFLNWSMFLAGLDAHAFRNPEQIAEKGIAFEAMERLKRLAEKMPTQIYAMNPIQVAEAMVHQDDWLYCPFAYSYSNYTRSHFCDHPLQYGNLMTLENGKRLRSILGGTGIAITQRCEDLELAWDFTSFAASGPIQTGIYLFGGGQPAHQQAWDLEDGLDPTSGFFKATRLSQSEALVRPRYDGYVPLQEEAGIPLQNVLQSDISKETAWEQINRCYRQSLNPNA